MLEKEELERMYWVEQMSLSDIAEEVGKSAPTVHRWMDKLDIPRRSDVEGGKLARRVEYARYRIGPEGYPMTTCWDPVKQDNEFARIHQLLVIAEGADPYDVFDGQGETSIHHINGCKFDNRPSNLKLMQHSKHVSHHHNHGDLDTSGLNNE